MEGGWSTAGDAGNTPWRWQGRRHYGALMNIKQKKKAKLTFGDFITAAYQNWGAKRAVSMVQKAVAQRSIVFQKQSDYFDFLREKTDLQTISKGFNGRFKFGPRAAALGVMLGCAGLATGAQAGEVIVEVPAPRVRVFVPPPPVIEVHPPGFFIFGGDYDRRHDVDDYRRRGRDSRDWAHRHGDEHRDGDRKR